MKYYDDTFLFKLLILKYFWELGAKESIGIAWANFARKDYEVKAKRFFNIQFGDIFKTSW